MPCPGVRSGEGVRPSGFERKNKGVGGQVELHWRVVRPLGFGRFGVPPAIAEVTRAAGAEGG